MQNNFYKYLKVCDDVILSNKYNTVKSKVTELTENLIVVDHKYKFDKNTGKQYRRFLWKGYCGNVYDDWYLEEAITC